MFFKVVYYTHSGYGKLVVCCTCISFEGGYQVVRKFYTCKWKSFVDIQFWCFQFYTWEWKSFVEIHFWCYQFCTCKMEIHCGNPFLIVTNSVLVNGNPLRKSSSGVSKSIVETHFWCYQFCICEWTSSEEIQFWCFQIHCGNPFLMSPILYLWMEILWGNPGLVFPNPFW